MLALFRKKTRRRKRPKKRLRGRRLLLFMLLFAVFGGGGFWWYTKQDRPTQEKVEQVTLVVLDLVRENRHLPPEAALILDWVADRIPLHIGYTIPVENFDGDRTHLWGGAPRTDRRLRILENQGFLVGYDEDRGNPAWVAYRAFTPDSWTAPTRPDQFVPDRRTRARITPDLYTNSGFDRGHLAPNYAIAVMHGPEAQLETFRMSNISPQTPALNRRIWAELEQRIIRRYSRRFSEVWVINGPVYPEVGKQRIQNQVAIPEAFFKIIIDEHRDGVRVLAFLIPQSVTGNEDPGKYLTSVREIEKRTGLDFFPELTVEEQDLLEVHRNSRVW